MQFAVTERLVDGNQASIDGTTVAANASRRKLANMQQIERRLEQAMSPLHESTPTAFAEAHTSAQHMAPGWMAPTDTGKREQHARYLRVKARLVELLAENSRRRSDKRKPVDRIVVSLTDPESVFSLDKLKVYRPLYNVQTVSDLATDFVLACEVFAQHSDSGTLSIMIDRNIPSKHHRQRTTHLRSAQEYFQEADQSLLCRPAAQSDVRSVVGV